MAAFPMGYKTVYKDQNLPIQSIIRHNGKRPIYDSVDILRSFSSIPGLICRRFYPSYAVGDIFTKSRTLEGIAPRCLANRLRFTQGYYSNRDKFSSVWYSTGSGTNEKQLRSLDSYFGKLHDNAKLSPLDSSNQVMQVHHSKGQPISKNGLESLNDYLGKLNNGANQEPPVPSTYIEHYNEDNRAPKQLSINKETEQSYYGKQNTYVNIRRKKDEHGPNSFRDTRQQDEASSLYLIGILASINIAVFLFEIASPIRNTDLELFSLPLLYGAKINHLIVVGEWWRLVTPMFLVQD